MAKKKVSGNTEKLVDAITNGISEVKGEEITCLDLRNIKHAIADYFIVCHGNSHTQVEAIARSVERETETKLDESPWHKEGLHNAEWALLDYIDVVVHIFHKDFRGFYGLEELWADAEIKEIAQGRA